METSSTTPSTTDPPRSVTPPGVTNGTLDDERALLAAHVASLRAAGYRLEENSGDSRTVYAATANYSSFRVIPGRTTSTPDIWANETLTLARLARENRTTYQRPPRFWASPARMTGASSLRVLFNASTYVREGTATCGDRSCTVLTATGSSRFRNFTAEALVDDSGIVHRFHATYARSGRNRSTTVEYRLTVTRLGNVTVRRPPWVDTAIARTE